MGLWFFGFQASSQFHPPRKLTANMDVLAVRNKGLELSWGGIRDGRPDKPCRDFWRLCGHSAEAVLKVWQRFQSGSEGLDIVHLLVALHFCCAQHTTSNRHVFEAVSMDPTVTRRIIATAVQTLCGLTDTHFYVSCLLVCEFSCI